MPFVVKQVSKRQHSGRLGWCLLMCTVVLGPAVARGDHIDDKLREAAQVARLQQWLKEHPEYQTVGVLKFSVQAGSQTPSLNRGTLPGKMATRLENVLGLISDPKHPVGIIQDAGKQASSRSRGATYRDAKSRGSLFTPSYALAWGKEQRQPDVFLTGDVILSKNNKQATVVVKAFDKKSPGKMQEVLRIPNIPTDRNILASAGQSFVVPRGKLKRGPRDADDAAAEDATLLDQTSSNPLNNPEDPVKLEIFYDGQPVGLEPDSSSPGELRAKSTTAKDPKQGQQVRFVLRNTSKEKVAAVLAVNGKSTLFQEDLASRPPAECTKWVLAAGQAYTIDGFYMSEDGKALHHFHVLSDADSEKVELDPEHKGVFSLYVFREGSGEAGMDISAGDGELSARSRSRSASFAEWQASLQKANHTRFQGGRLVAEKKPSVQHHRGIVVPGAEAKSGGKLNRVDFKVDPQPAMALFIRYWRNPIVD